MNHMMLQCLALCAIVMVTTSAPAINSKFQRDKLKLTNLIREVGGTIDELELDIEEAEKREQASPEEPIIEAEISEDETQAKKEEERGHKDTSLEVVDLVEKGRRKKKPRPEFNSDIDFNIEEKEEAGDSDKSSLRDVLRMLLKLENSERSSTDNANDNHDFPMPLTK